VTLSALPSPPSATAAREALSRALTDAPGEVRVSWWDDGLTAARDAHPGDVGPHWRGTLAQLAELLAAERSVTAAKGTGRALCGAAVRQLADGWRRRRTSLDGWALAQLDLDPPAAGASRGEGDGPSVASVAAGLRALGVAAIVHPSPSARVGGGASTRVRAWVMVAEAGGPVRGDASALADAGAALAVALGAALGAHPRGVDREKCRPEALGYTSAVHAAALGGVELCAGRAIDPGRLAAEAVAAGWWHPFARGRVGAVARDLAALAELLAAVEAVHPGTIGRQLAGATCLRCPRAAEHTDGRGFGGDNSCALTAAGWVGCSHSHGGDGPLTLRGMVAAWGVGLDAATRGGLSRALRGAEAPRTLARLDAPHAGAPGDAAPGVAWEVLPAVADIEAARAGAVEALRRAVHAWGAEAVHPVCVAAVLPAPLAPSARSCAPGGGARQCGALDAAAVGLDAPPSTASVCDPRGVRRLPRRDVAAPGWCAASALAPRSTWLRYDARHMTAVIGRRSPSAGRCTPGGLDASDAGSIEGGAVDPCDASAEAVCRPPAVRPEAWVVLAPMGSGKSTAALAELPALLPPPPGWTDDRAPSPRPLAVVVTETRGAARTVAATLARAAREHPGAVEGLRVARHLPVSRVALGGGEALTDDAPRECAHPTLAEVLEKRGLPVGPSLCRVVGTDDPARVGLDGIGRPCPRLATCPAAAGWTWVDGAPGAPAAGDRWIGVATADSAAALPAVVHGGPHVVDECARLASTSPASIPSDGGTVLARAEALRAVLPRESPAARERLDAAKRPWARSIVAAAWAGLVTWVRGLCARGELTAAHGLGASPGERRALLCAHLDAWASAHTPGDGGENARRNLARLAWPAVGGASGALDAWERAAPTVGSWSKPEARAAGGELWRALAAWVAGAVAAPTVEAVRGESTDDGAEGDAWSERATGGVTVRVPHVAAREARTWITRGPVVGLDATADASALARALGALDARGTIGGVRAVSLAVADPAGVSVRRVMLATDRAGRGRLLSRDGCVAWGIAAGVVRAALDAVAREAPRVCGASRHGHAADDGAPLAPGMVLAARPLALALAALAEGLDGGAVLRGGCSAELLAALDGAGDDARAQLARSIEAAPAEVREAASALARRGSVRWTWHGGTEARGSNALASAGGRWVLTIGDGRAPTAEARARGAGVGRDAWAQGERDAAEALAQAHGRVRAHALPGGAVLLCHVGAVRPLGWDGPEVRPLDAPGASPASARRALPAAPRVEAAEVSPDAHPHVAALLSRGWTVTALAACAGCDPRVARRWARGAHPRDAGALAALAAAVEAGDDARAPWRRVLRPGRRALDVLRGARGVPGLDGLCALAVAEGLATEGGVTPGLRQLAPGEVSAEALAAWVRGDDAAVSVEAAAVLAAVGPMVARWWAGGASAEASARGDIARTLTRARAAAPGAAERDALTVAAEALAARVAEAADAPRRHAAERRQLRAEAERGEALARAAEAVRQRRG